METPNAEDRSRAEEPSAETFGYARREALWSYPTLILNICVWNFPVGIVFAAYHSLLWLVIWYIFSLLVIVCIWGMCSDESVVGYEGVSIPTKGRAIILTVFQLALPAVGWWIAHGTG